MRHGRMLYGRVVHLVDDRQLSVCGRVPTLWSEWIYKPTLLRGYPRCKLCAKGDRLRMPTT